MIRLPENYIGEMVAHALEEAPYECGGVIAGKDDEAVRLYKVETGAKSTMLYNAEAKANLRVMREIDDGDWTVLALWHSHTHSQAYPSPTDVEVARVWMGSCHFIIVSVQNRNTPVVRAFKIMDGVVMEDELGVRG